MTNPTMPIDVAAKVMIASWPDVFTAVEAAIDPAPQIVFKTNDGNSICVTGIPATVSIFQFIQILEAAFYWVHFNHWKASSL